MKYPKFLFTAAEEDYYGLWELSGSIEDDPECNIDLDERMMFVWVFIEIGFLQLLFKKWGTKEPYEQIVDNDTIREVIFDKKNWSWEQENGTFCFYVTTTDQGSEYYKSL